MYINKFVTIILIVSFLYVGNSNVSKEKLKFKIKSFIKIF